MDLSPISDGHDSDGTRETDMLAAKDALSGHALFREIMHDTLPPPQLRATCHKAQTLIPEKEYLRVSEILRPYASTSKALRRIRWYALFHDNKRREQRHEGLLVPTFKGQMPIPTTIADLITEITQFPIEDLLGYDLYTLALCYEAKSLYQKALNACAAAYAKNPFITEVWSLLLTLAKKLRLNCEDVVDLLCKQPNFSTPTNLSTLLDTMQFQERQNSRMNVNNVHIVQPPQHSQARFDRYAELVVSTLWQYVHARLLLELNAEYRAAYFKFSEIYKAFPSKTEFTAQCALSLYHLRSFEESRVLFASLLADEPFSLAHMDKYSNVLYVLGATEDLSELASHAAQVDVNRHETLCILGNFYSHRREHEKAIFYFRKGLARAHRCDVNCSWIYTLIGHEYIELRLPYEAIDSYQNAVMHNKREVTAYYGLGQVYELLGMASYAIHHYKKACEIVPSDARLWLALGDLFEKIACEANQAQDRSAQIQHAAAYYTRAKKLDLSHDDRAILYFKLGKLALALSDKAKAVKLFNKALHAKAILNPSLLTNAESDLLCSKVHEYLAQLS